MSSKAVGSSSSKKTTPAKNQPDQSSVAELEPANATNNDEAEPEETIEWALAYARSGFAVMPVWPRRRKTPEETLAALDAAAKKGEEPNAYARSAWTCFCDKGIQCERPAKHPIPKQGVKQATTSEDRIIAWWDEYPTANIGIATGSQSKIIVIDVDTADGKEGDISLTSACAERGGVPRTLKARSGSGGVHYVYKFRENPYTRKIGFLKHVDYLSDGGYVIVEPSMNLLGVYRWDLEFAPEDENAADLIGDLRKHLADLPEWFDALEGAGRAGKKGDKKERNDAAFRARIVNGAAMEFKPSDPKWIEEVAKALTHCDPDSRDDWVLFGLILGRAFERGEDGWTIYNEWSSRSAKYEDKGTQKAMRGYYYDESTSMPQGGEPATIATIFRRAQEGGWSFPVGGLDRRPVVAYRAGRALETAETVLELLAREREAGTDEGLRIYAFGSGLGAVIEAHDFGAMYSSEGKPPNGWPMKVHAYTPMGFGSRVTHVATIVRFSATGSTTQVECPPEVSSLMLSTYSKHFPRLNGIVQWPIVINNRISGFDEAYDAKSGIVFNLPDGLDLSGIKGTKKEAEAAYKWIIDVALEGFPLEPRERAAALSLLLTFMQRRVMKTAPAFLITAPSPGTGKTALAQFCSRVVHGRSLGAASLSMISEEQRKAITATLIENNPAHLFDNVKAGTSFNSEELAVATTASEWKDRKLGESTQLTLPNRTVWCFTGNNVTVKGDLKRRFVTIRLVSKVREHYAQRFSRSLDEWSIEHRNECLAALATIALWGSTSEANKKLLSESGFPEWDRQVRSVVFSLTGIDPFYASSGEQSDAEVEDEEGEATAAVAVAWTLFVGEEKMTVRDFIAKAHDGKKSSNPDLKRAAEAFSSAVATLRGEKEDRLAPEDFGYAVKLLQDRILEVDGVEIQFRREGLRHKVALWRLAGAEKLKAILEKDF